MPRYIIERDIPDIGSAECEALREAAEKSNGVLAEMKSEQKIFSGNIPMSLEIRRSVFA